MVDFHFLNFNSPPHVAACVQINWNAVVVFSAPLDINMQLLAGFQRESGRSTYICGSLSIIYKARNSEIYWK